jgi:conjugal transfer pilus assembly protein TraK
MTNELTQKVCDRAPHRGEAGRGMGPAVARLSLLAMLLTVANSTASAAQFIDTRDGDTAIASMSIKDQTRIRLERGRITDVIGDVYSKDRNPAGRLVVIADEEDGELYVRPVDGSTRSVKVDLRTDRGKFSLLLQPVDMPGDTLVLRPRGMAMPAGAAQQAPENECAAQSLPPAQALAAPMPRNMAHVRALKALTLAMAGQELPADVEVRDLNLAVTLWREARLVLLSTYLARELVGERYELSNVSESILVIDEREFYRDGVQSVSVMTHQLAPGARTAVWVVRSRLASD